MQAQIDEAIEKLQSALKQIDEAQPLCPSPGCDILSNAGMNVDLALAKLKEVPEQGAFTKNILANLERTISQLRQQKTSIISQLNQQIDQLQAENKKLVEEQKAKKEAGS